MPRLFKNHYWAIIPAAGMGTRMETTIAKQYLPLLDGVVIEKTLQKFLSHSGIPEIILALSRQDQYWRKLTLSAHKKITTVHGGAERHYSVWEVLQFLKNKASANDWVLVHDAVRPCLHPEDLNKLIMHLVDHPVGGLLATPIKDTIKRVNKQGNVVATIDRSELWAAQTPQMYRFEKLFKAMQHVIKNNLSITDETAALEVMGEQPLIVPGRHDNIKITYPLDLALAENILLSQQKILQRV